MLKDFFLNEIKIAISKTITDGKLGQMSENDEYTLIIEKPKKTEFGR